MRRREKARTAPALAPPTVAVVRTSYLIFIAAAFGVTPAAIMEANGIADASTIYAGREVAIPGVAP
jgi:LysM repeat protein